MKRRRFFEALTATLLAVLIGAVLAAPAMAQGNSGKNKDGGGGGGGDGPPVQYEVTWFGNLGGDPFYVRDINNWGVIVGTGWDGDGPDFSGTRRAWVLLPTDVDGDGILDYSNDMIIDINDMKNADDEPIVPEGWRANRASSINDVGEVTGTLWDGTRGAIYKLNLMSRSMIIIDYDWESEPSINDMGEIIYLKSVDGERYVHMYSSVTGNIVNLGLTGGGSINNVPQIAGTSSATRKPFRYTLPTYDSEGNLLVAGTLLEFGKAGEFLFRGGLNDSGSVMLYSEKGQGEAIRYSDSLGYETIAKGYGIPRGINNSGDVLLERSKRGTLYMDEYGLLPLDDLLTGTVEDVNRWRDSSEFAIYKFNDRNEETGFAEICGVQTFDGVQFGFILRPVVNP